MSDEQTGIQPPDHMLGSYRTTRQCSANAIPLVERCPRPVAIVGKAVYISDNSF
jgi:hypothetical protein